MDTSVLTRRAELETDLASEARTPDRIFSTRWCGNVSADRAGRYERRFF